jgi:predicted GNAT superfamily acetyltransferase
MNSPSSPETLDTVTSVASRSASAGPALTPDVVAAGAAAVDAATAAGVEIRLLDGTTGFEETGRLFGSIWGPESTPMSSELMRAFAHAGNYVAAAYDGDGVAGGCVGFFGPPGSGTMHSHVAGVAPAARGRNIGYALKLHQHAWALDHDVREITWTFDPLVRRNAYFNIAKLGALPAAYLPNFYGAMADGINAGQDSDRLLMSWPVDPQHRAGRRDSEPVGAQVLLDEDDDGRPLPASGAGSPARHLLVRVPRDIELLRRRDPAVARTWRIAVRDQLRGLLLDGGQVTGFTRSGFYVVDGGGS